MSASDDNIVLFRRAPAELDRRQVERFARVLREQVAEGAAFQCLISDDRELRRLNREFLGKDYATDVLSFPAACSRARRTEPRPSGSGLLGEMAISANRAREQASEFGHSLEEEISILMLHGLLHLMGMDHENDRGKMARVEAKWRARLTLSAGLIERVRA